MNSKTPYNYSCLSCAKELHPDILDMGYQPVCSRYPANVTDKEYTHPLALGACSSCGLLQILDPVPIKELAHGFSWIKYNEPENHLENLVDMLLSMTEIKGSYAAAGVSYKDDTTLERLRKRRACKVVKIDKHHGNVDILVVRHILEHAQDISMFLATLKALVKPEGVLVFEVPDCTPAFTLKDYSIIWEEHVLYFTPLTLQLCLESHGFKVLCMKNYSYSLENSLVIIAQQRSAEHDPLTISDQDRDKELKRTLNYLNSFQSERARYRQIFAEYRNRGDRIVLLGAGHLSCSFVNLFGLQQYIECILDDDSNKQGLFMPGSKLPVRKTSFLLTEKNIKLCLLGVNPIGEDKVININKNFFDVGGNFYSIFPSSKHALKI